MFAGTVGIAILLSADVLALGILGEPPLVTASTIAIYQVGSMLARLPYFMGDALANSVFPFIARRHDSSVASHAYFAAAARWTLIAVVPIEIVLLMTPAPVLEVFFPSTYASSAPIVRLLAIGALGALATGFFGKALQALGKSGRAAAAILLGVVVEITVASLLIPRLGGVGAALAMVSGAWSAAAVLCVLYIQHQRMRLLSAAPAIRYGVAVASSLPLLLLATNLDRLGGIVAISMAMAVYGMALVLLGVVRVEELRRYISIAGGLFTPSPHPDQ
jgi:O-antigen/teichoic acid export membrane protein